MQYKKNYLRQVIFNINYNPIEVLKVNLDAKLQTMCEQITSSKLSVGKTTSIQIQADQTFDTSHQSIWEFKGESIQIKIQVNNLQIINLAYTVHDEYHNLIAEVYDYFVAQYAPTITRTSFRYVNVIAFTTGDAFDFKTYINPALLSATNEFNKGNLARSIGSIIVKDDAVTTNFIYGFYNPQFPNKIATRDFILDYDASLNLNGEKERIKDILDKLRLTINNLFEKSILDELRNLMNA